MDPQRFLKVKHFLSLNICWKRETWAENVLIFFKSCWLNCVPYSCKVPAGLTALLYMCQSLTIDRSPPTHIHTYSHHVLKLLTVIIRHSECLLANTKAVLIVINVIKELLKPKKAALTIHHKTLFCIGQNDKFWVMIIVLLVSLINHLNTGCIFRLNVMEYVSRRKQDYISQINVIIWNTIN